MKISYIILLVIVCLQTALSTQQFWNSVYYIQGTLSQKNGQHDQHSQPPAKLSKDSPFYLQIFANDTFQLIIQEGALKIYGQAFLKERFALSKNSYVLYSNDRSTKFQGNVTYQVQLGVKWTCSFYIPSKDIKVKIQQVKHQYLAIILSILFGSVSVFCFSINYGEQKRIMHNLNKRCYYGNLVIFATKQMWAVSGLVLIGFIACYDLYNSYYYLIPFQLGLIIFCFLPTVIHYAFVGMTIQKKLPKIQFFKNQAKQVQCLIMYASVFTFTIAIPLAIYLQISIVILYLLAIGNIIQVYHTYKQQKYPYSSVVILDFIITFILSNFLLYLPVLNFSLTSYKQIILFWNFYLFIIIFNLIFYKTSVKSEAISEIQIGQETTTTHRQKIAQQLTQDDKSTHQI